MGLLGRLFKKDPFKELEKCETLVAKGDDLEKALKIASNLVEHDSRDIASKAQGLAQLIKQKLVESMIKNATRSESSGNIQDAADWLTSALAYVDDDTTRNEIATRINALRGGDEDEPVAPLISAKTSPEEDDEDDDDELEEKAYEDHSIDFEFHFETLVGMLKESIAEEYLKGSETFHQAYVAFNDNRMDQARELYDALLSGGPSNPCYQLEGARMYLVDGKLEEAEALLEKAWPYFGDSCIDESESISVPILWADVKLRQEQSQAVVTRLETQARQKTASPILCQFYALALQNCGEFEVARKYLVDIASRYDKNPNFRFLLAGVLVQMDKKDAAIQVLETVVGPSCAGGSCGTGAKHPASMRMLTALLLERNGKGDLNQAGQILMHLEQALIGQLSKNDLLMTARYHRLCNDEAAAILAENEAERLSEEEQDALAAAGPSIGSTSEKAVL